MAYLKVECSVARNKKFVKAGPAPSWLWICGLAYCQEGLTDGFIPKEALPYLGVKNASQLADHLVKAGLWIAADEGWMVNDYLEHNRSAADVAEIKSKRGNGGKLGGRPPKTKPSGNLEGLPRETSSEAVADDAAVAAVGSSEGMQGEPFDGQAALAELQRRYPPDRVTFGYRTQSAFMEQCPDVETFATMVANLEQHRASHEWSVKGMAPALEKWLRDGLWRRQMSQAPPIAEQMNKSTAVTLGGAAAFVNGGR
jgi:hypothetical protein